ncbi:hypothetical protein OIA45_45480 (plasmid) [Streptomyces chartreusis]|uniref:hypothetical protein n=1 Tax=Streptomyces chartreusis TaxID=1969 RepID=UPI002F91BE80|nr:hypothetical protein OIA45_45480 [Streptomyces chartreusis]
MTRPLYGGGARASLPTAAAVSASAGRATDAEAPAPSYPRLSLSATAHDAGEVHTVGTTYLARVTFPAATPSTKKESPVAYGPRVEGEWDVLDTALDRYNQWLRLYSGHPNVTVQLIKKTDGREHVLRPRTAPGESTPRPRGT